MVVGKKVTKESILPPVCEDDRDEGGKEEDLGGIASRPVSRPRSLYSRGSVDGQVSVPAQSLCSFICLCVRKHTMRVSGLNVI